jgi:hypothetical protein
LTAAWSNPHSHAVPGVPTLHCGFCTSSIVGVLPFRLICAPIACRRPVHRIHPVTGLTRLGTQQRSAARSARLSQKGGLSSAPKWSKENSTRHLRHLGREKERILFRAFPGAQARPPPPSPATHGTPGATGTSGSPFLFFPICDFLGTRAFAAREFCAYRADHPFFAFLTGA